MKNSFVITIIIVSACLMILAAGWWWLTRTPQPSQLPVRQITLHTQTGPHLLQVELATTPVAQARGLMFRKSLAPNNGMLFLFNRQRPSMLEFWMKNTLIPLDIIFLDQQGRIINIEANTTPLSTTPIRAAAPAVAVLEVAGGQAAAWGLRPGDWLEDEFFENLRVPKPKLGVNG